MPPWPASCCCRAGVRSIDPGRPRRRRGPAPGLEPNVRGRLRRRARAHQPGDINRSVAADGRGRRQARWCPQRRRCSRRFAAERLELAAAQRTAGAGQVDHSWSTWLLGSSLQPHAGLNRTPPMDCPVRRSRCRCLEPRQPAAGCSTGMCTVALLRLGCIASAPAHPKAGRHAPVHAPAFHAVPHRYRCEPVSRHCVLKRHTSGWAPPASRLPPHPVPCARGVCSKLGGVTASGARGRTAPDWVQRWGGRRRWRTDSRLGDARCRTPTDNRGGRPALTGQPGGGREGCDASVREASPRTAASSRLFVFCWSPVHHQACRDRGKLLRSSDSRQGHRSLLSANRDRTSCKPAVALPQAAGSAWGPASARRKAAARWAGGGDLGAGRQPPPCQ